jgi:molecular chaperone HscC
MQLGIDLGTTNSLCAFFTDDGTTTLVPNVHGDVLTPSVIGLTDEGEIVVGKTAADRLVTHPERTLAAFKRAMGTDHRFELGRQKFRAEELSAILLRALVRDAEEVLGERIERAVISVPAYFNDAQRRATYLAGELAGIEVERLINEPTAAALAYGLHEGRDESTFLVFDLGGGTFDVSILELFDGVMEVHASAGDNFLGGEDFVNVLVDHFVRQTGWEPSREGLALVRASAERVKRELTKNSSATMSANRGSERIELTVTESDLEALSAELLSRLRQPVERALRDARLRLDGLDEVVLVGGATRMPLVQKLVARMFGTLPLRRINPDEVVARGAAVQAALSTRHKALEDVVMTDVCPYTLGIAASQQISPGKYLHNTFSPILERNTVIPASRVETYYPLSDDQAEIEIDIYQGESRRLDENIKLGELVVRLPRGGDRSVDIRFTYDTNGLLEVIATVRATGASTDLVIEQQRGRMSDGEKRAALKRLEALKVHPRELEENKALTHRADRLYRELLGDERDLLAMFIGQWEAVLDKQDPNEIRKMRARLKEELDALE